MAGQQDGLKDVLCLHQTVAVPPQLSNEGRYSVLLFFDTESVLIENPERGGRGRVGQVESEGGGPMMPPDQEKGGGLDQESENKLWQRSGRQACHDLSKAMGILLSGGGTDADDELSKVEADVSFNDSGNYRSTTSKNSRVFDGVRRIGGENVKEEGTDGDCGAGGGGDPDQYSSTLERSRRSTRPSDSPSEDLQRGLEGEQLESRLVLEFGMANKMRGDSLEGRPLSDAARTNGDGGQSEIEDVEEDKERAVIREKDQHKQQHVQLVSPSVAIENEAAEYSSGDESSATPRVDLLLSPYRASTSAKSTITATTEQVARETLLMSSCIAPAVDFGGADCERSREEAKNDKAMGTNKDKLGKFGQTQQDTVPGPTDCGKTTAIAENEDATQSSTPKILRLSLDGYEDDFCCDNEDDSSSLAQPEAGGIGSTGKGFDTTVGNKNNNAYKEGNFEGTDDRSDIIRGGNVGGVAGGVDDDSSISDGMYSGTAAGGFEVDINGGGASGGLGYSHFCNDDTSLGGSSEERVGEEDVWAICSPPRSPASQHNSSSRHGDKMKTRDHDR